MNKELEHLEIIEDWANEHHDSEEVWEHSIPVQEALKRLKAIDNANPSEALEWLKQQAIAFEHSELAIKVANGNYASIKQALLKSQEQEEIIKEYDLQPYELREALLLYAMYKGEYKGNPLPALKQAQEQKAVLKWLFEFLFLEPKQIDDKYYITYMNREEGNYILEEVSKEDYNLLKEFYHGLREGIY